MKADVEVRAEQDLAPREKETLLGWVGDVFQDDVGDLSWSDVDWHVLVWAGGEVVSHVEIVDRTCTAGGQPVRVGGVGGVATRDGWRGQGLGSLAMERAARLLCGELGCEFGLLICDPTMIPFYERLGWLAVPDPLFFEQPAGRMENDGATMIWRCGDREWPAGEIDLCGLPW